MSKVVLDVNSLHMHCGVVVEIYETFIELTFPQDDVLKIQMAHLLNVEGATKVTSLRLYRHRLLDLQN